MTEYKHGAFIFTRDRGVKYMTPEELIQIIPGKPGDLLSLPKYTSDRLVMSRVVADAQPSLPKGYKLVQAKASKKYTKYSLMLDGKPVGLLEWHHTDGMHLSFEEGKTPSPDVEQALLALTLLAYRERVGRIGPQDWSSWIRTFMADCGAVRVRWDGRVFWATGRQLAAIEPGAVLLSLVGIDMFVCPADVEQVRKISDAIHSELEEMILPFEQEQASARFAQCRPATLSRRMEAYETVMMLVLDYAASSGLDFRAESARLGALQAHVRARMSKPVEPQPAAEQPGQPKPEQPEPVPVPEPEPALPPPPPPPPPSPPLPVVKSDTPPDYYLVFAGADFVAVPGTPGVFECAEPDAVEAVLEIGAGGLVNRPLPLGTDGKATMSFGLTDGIAQIHIQHSGNLFDLVAPLGAFGIVLLEQPRR